MTDSSNGYRPRAGSKEETIMKLALRPAGVSGKEAKAALNWKAIQLVKHINDIAFGLGLEYESELRGREVVYRIIPAAKPAKSAAVKKAAKAPAKKVAPAKVVKKAAASNVVRLPVKKAKRRAA